MSKIFNLKTIGSVLFMMFIVATVFLTTRQVSNPATRQETRSRAATTDVTLGLTTASPTNTFYYKSGMTIDTNIVINTAGNAVKGIDIGLTYDPTKFDVVDVDAITAGTQISAGTILTTPLQNLVDTVNGKIWFSCGYDLSTKIPFTGTGTLATIQFKPKVAVDPTTVAFMASPDTQVLLATGTVGPTTPTNGVFHILSDTTAPTVPALSTPADAAKLNSRTVPFTWAASTDAGSGLANYEIQVGTANPPASPYSYNVTPTSNSTSNTFSADGTYYWRVNAKDNVGNVSAWSSPVRSFTIDTVAPGAPTLSAPANNSYSTSRTVAMSWSAASDPSPSSGIASYNIQTATDSNCSTGLLTYTSTTTSYSNTFGADGVYYWHVAAIDGASNVGSYSACWKVTVDSVTPSLPILQSPTTGIYINTRTPTLTWAASTDATSGVNHYDIQISTTSNFTGPTTTSYTSTTTSYTLTTALTADGLFYWHVMATDNAGNASAWSTNSNFNVDSVAPGTPGLSSPLNGANLTSLTVNFSWTAVTDSGSGLANYEIQVGTANPPTAPYSFSNAPTTNSTSTTLSADGTYYWRVRAKDTAGNYGSWSSVFSFTVDSTPPSAVTNLAAGSPTTSSLTLTWMAPNANPGTATSYDIRYSTATITSANFSSATSVPGTPTPAAPGTSQSVVVSGLTAGTTYYFAMKSTDSTGNVSSISNVTSGTVSQLPVTLNFTVKIDGALPSTTPRLNTTVDIVVEPAAGGTPLGTFTGIAVTNNNTTGTYGNSSPVTLTGIQAGSYRILVKGGSQLRREVASTSLPQALNPGLNTVDWTATAKILLGGDASGDNRVDMSDFDILATDYRSATSSRADFNLDAWVDMSDFDILATNYRLSGDPL